MANIRVQAAGPLVGALSELPGDKSISQRALIFAALAKGRSTLKGLSNGEDCLATLNALRQFGVKITALSNSTWQVESQGFSHFTQPNEPLNLANSGTGFRLLAGVCAGLPFTTTLIGDESLSKRPMQRIITPLTKMGASISSNHGTAPLTINGSASLTALHYAIPTASAQVKSAILLAALTARGETSLSVPLPCRDHSERMLPAFGVRLSFDALRVKLVGPQQLSAADLTVPCDLSAAAFFLVAAAICPGSDITLTNVGINPSRAGVITVLQKMGANISIKPEAALGEEPVASIRVRYNGRLQAVTVDADLLALAIDEAPILFIASASANGVSRFEGIDELRHKESDRVAAMREGLATLGISSSEDNGQLTIRGGEFCGGYINSYADHRIAMAFAIAASISKEAVIIADCDRIATSFPAFWQNSKQLGLEGVAL